ncbi:MAG: ATP-binding protein [Pseudomonadota bacterium]
MNSLPPLVSPEDPEFLWDPVGLRVVQANDEAVRFWGEDTLYDLMQRRFASGDVTSTALHAQFQALTPGATLSARVCIAAKICHGDHMADFSLLPNEPGAGLLRVVVRDEAQADDSALPLRAAGFDHSAEPKVVIAADGKILARNGADIRFFPDGGDSLRNRYPTKGLLDTAINLTLAQGSHDQKVQLSAGSADRPFRVFMAPLPPGRSGERLILVELREEIAHQPRPYVTGRVVTTEAIASLIHDVRSPLGAVQGLADFMRLSGDTISSDQRAEYLSGIMRAGHRMMAIIDRVVALGDPQSDTDVTAIDRFDLTALIGDAARLHRPGMMAAGVDLVLAGSEQPIFVVGNFDATMRILDNLIDNATRHGVSGGGMVRLSAMAATDDAPASVTICDDGQGMAEGDIEAALSDGGETGRRSFGLRNCAALAGSMAAHLHVTATPGQGVSAQLVFAPDQGLGRTQHGS